MKKLIYTIFAIAIITVIFSCSKEEIKPLSDDSSVAAFTFIRMDAPDTVFVNENDPIVAVAEGSNLTYTWSIDIGILLGSGNQVTFSACCEGPHLITCEVSDGVTTLSKTKRIWGVSSIDK